MDRYYRDAFEALKALVANSKCPDFTLERLVTKLAPLPEALDLAAKHGAWSEHPPLESGRSISAEDWACEVGAGNTRLGYWDWVCGQLEVDQEESESEQAEAG